MENNTENNVGGNVGKKKNNPIIMIIIIILILAVITIIVLRNSNPKIQTQLLSQSDIELNQAVASDTTISINDSINSINLDDTSDTDLIPVDQELQKL